MSSENGRWKEQRSWLIPEVFDDDGELIVDEVAVRTIISGKRKVRSTHTERRRAVIAMAAEGLTILDMAQHIGTRSQDVMRYLDELGFELLEDALLDKSHRRKLIVTRDRPRGPKILTGSESPLMELKFPTGNTGRRKVA